MSATNRIRVFDYTDKTGIPSQVAFEIHDDDDVINVHAVKCGRYMCVATVYEFSKPTPLIHVPVPIGTGLVEFVLQKVKEVRDGGGTA